MNRFADRLAALERPHLPDHWRSDATRRLLAARIGAVVRNFEAGRAPDNIVGQMIVDHDGDLVAALEALAERA